VVRRSNQGLCIDLSSCNLARSIRPQVFLIYSRSPRLLLCNPGNAIRRGQAMARPTSLGNTALCCNCSGQEQFRTMSLARETLQGSHPEMRPTDVYQTFRHWISRGPGFLALDLNASRSKSKLELTREAIKTLSGLGTLMPQSAKGNVLYLVQEGPKTLRGAQDYSRSRQGGDFHTDGTYMYETPPDLLALLCLRRSPTGGESILIDGLKIARILRRKSPIVYALLQSSFYFDACDQQGKRKVFQRPILSTKHHTQFRVNYLRSLIEAGHRVAGSPLSIDQTQALDTFDTLLADHRLQLKLPLEPGVILIVNNHRMLHGRVGFRDSEVPQGRRLLLRLWARMPGVQMNAP